MELISLLSINASVNDSSQRIISILSIGFVTITILWILMFLKSRKLKAKIKRLENKQ